MKISEQAEQEMTQRREKRKLELAINLKQALKVQEKDRERTQSLLNKLDEDKLEEVELAMAARQY